MESLLLKSCDSKYYIDPALELAKIKELLPKNWHIMYSTLGGDPQNIVRYYHFDDFHKSVAFVEKICKLSKEEDHHPRIVLDITTVTVTLYTRNGYQDLTMNDFIMAAKINEVFKNA